MKGQINLLMKLLKLQLINYFDNLQLNPELVIESMILSILKFLPFILTCPLANITSKSSTLATLFTAFSTDLTQ